MTRRGRKAQAASSTPAPGNTGDPERDAPLIDYFSATPAYFEAVGARLVQGRVFEPATGDGPAEAVIDAALARRFFPEGGAVGSSLVLGDALTVVGVVDQIRLYDVQSDDRGQVYLPLRRTRPPP